MSGETTSPASSQPVRLGLTFDYNQNKWGGTNHLGLEAQFRVAHFKMAGTPADLAIVAGANTSFNLDTYANYGTSALVDLRPQVGASLHLYALQSGAFTFGLGFSQTAGAEIDIQNDAVLKHAEAVAAPTTTAQLSAFLDIGSSVRLEVGGGATAAFWSTPTVTPAAHALLSFGF